MMRQLIFGLTMMYFGAGLFAGLLMERAIPALNFVGVGYIALTWPGQIICARIEDGCSTMPPEALQPYLFSF